MEGGPSLRRATADDCDALSKFQCANHGERWTRDAQRVIQEDALEHLRDSESPVTVVIAEDQTRIVGVVVYGPAAVPEPQSTPPLMIHSLGVVADRRREGIATSLKSRVIAEATSEGRQAVVSQVHRRNFQMRNLNEKLGVVDEPDPEDAEYRLSTAPLPPAE